MSEKVKKYPSITIPDIIFSIIIIFILALVSSIYVFVLVNSDALKALIEAEATVLGFFGLMAVYWLTSMDSRIDRLEQEKHECEAELGTTVTNSVEVAKPTPSKITFLYSESNILKIQIEEIQDAKERVANMASLIGVLLVTSLIANIGVLGFQSNYSDAIKSLEYPYFQLAGIGAGIPLMMFLESVWFIFSLLRRMGKKPK